MDRIIIKELKKIKPKRPILVEGLPGFGQVGRVVAEHLINELKAEKFAELHSPSFPPEVFVDADGLVHAIKNEFYYSKKHDIVILIGDTQSTDIRGQYELAGAIADYAKKLKVRQIITLGGYATGELKEAPAVFGAATDKKLIDAYSKHGVRFKSDSERGGIVGASGLLLTVGKLKGIEGVCLMGETPGHPLFVDAKSAGAVLEALQKVLGVKIGLKELEKRAKDIEKFRTTIQRMMKKAVEKAQTETEETTSEQLRYIG